MDYRGGKCLAIIPLLCLCLITIFCATAQATPTFPWETENSVGNALIQQQGSSVICEGIVERIAARNNPAYFVLRDAFTTECGAQVSKIVVLCRPPISLSNDQSISVQGTLGVLPGSSERCIYNPTVYGYFRDGKVQYWMPFSFLQLQAGCYKQELPLPTGPVPPSDASLLKKQAMAT